MMEYVNREHGDRVTDLKAKELFDEFLDEVLEPVHIGVLKYLPSEVLKAVDPIAYRCEFVDWLDAEGWECI